MMCPNWGFRPVFKAVTDCMIRAQRLAAACNARRGRLAAAYTAMVKARQLMLKCLVAVEGRDDGSSLGVCGPVYINFDIILATAHTFRGSMLPRTRRRRGMVSTLTWCDCSSDADWCL